MPNNKAMRVEEVDRFFAIETNNGAWSLIEKDDRSPADDVEMIHQAHASCFHWSRVGEPVNVVRAHCLLAKAYFAAGMGESGALWGDKTWNQTVEMGLESWDYAIGCEIMARTYAARGDRDRHEDLYAKALEAIEGLVPQDAELCKGQLSRGP